MAEPTVVTITPENQAEFIAAAEAAAKPTEPQQKPTEEAKAPVEGEAKAGEQKLEIPEKKTDAPAEDGPLDLQPYYNEYAETGALSDESRGVLKARLEKAGFPNADQLIDQHMAGAKADIEQARQKIFSHVGGESSYNEMVQWAAKNLSEAEILEYNEAVKDPRMVRLAVLGLKAQYTAAGGANSNTPAPDPKRVTPQSNVSNAGEPIRSDQQVAELVGDKRYTTDPGYRENVNQRIMASMKAGYLK